MTSFEVSAAHVAVMAAIHRLCFPPDEVWTETELGLLLATPGCAGRMTAAGGFVLARQAIDTADILTLAVLPAHRRRGCARRLIQDLLLDLQARGVTDVLLEVGADNTAARGLYDALGFRAVGLRRAYYRNNTDAVVMSLPLAEPGG